MTGLRRMMAALAAVGVMCMASATASAADGPSPTDVTTWFDLPENISTYGGKVDSLFDVIFWLTGVAFVVTEVLLILFVLKFRKKEGQKSQYVHGHHTMEMMWTIIPGIIFFSLALYQKGMWNDMKMDLPDRAECLEVQVFAKQFEWNFRYAGPDKQFGTDDDAYSQALYIPVHKKIYLEMRSLDVIHSLFLPHMRFKQDIVPGREHFGWFEATKTTAQAQKERGDNQFQYEIACAELCGNSHFKMMSKVVIMDSAEFDQWLSGKTGKPRPSTLDFWDEWGNSLGLVKKAPEAEASHE